MRLILLLVALASTTATVQTAAPDRYLSGPGVDLVEVLPPAPQPSSPHYDADRRTFRDTRTLLKRRAVPGPPATCARTCRPC